MSTAGQRHRYKRSQVIPWLFAASCGAATLACIGMLLALLWSVASQGYQYLDFEFLNSFPSRHAEKAGIKAALAGSLWLISLTAAISLPLGIGAAVYLEEYAGNSRWRRIIQTNISNLAGVPSIVYGILGLGLFVQAFRLGPSLISGALTLSLVVLPIVILATQEALRGVPDSIRHASYALGATRWQTVWRQVLPASLPGIMTGVILALSRAIGEAAPLIAVGAVTYAAFTPESVMDRYAALPLQIFNWARHPKVAFHQVAGAGIIVLLIVLVSMNTIAVFVRYRYGKRIRW